MSDKSKTNSPEERTEALKEALSRVRLKVEENKKKEENSGSVQGRLQKIATRADEKEQPALDKNKNKKKEKADLRETAKNANKHDEKVEDAKRKGIILPKDRKDEKDKENKDKDNKNNKEMTPEKQEAKMKEMFSKVKLPSGAEIHQEGPQWVLVSKDGKQRTDITDVMNTIDKFNRDVDAANAANRAQNAAQGKADGVTKDVNGNQSQADMMKGDGIKVNATNDKAVLVGEALPKVKDVNGNQVFKPEDIKTVAETALSFSDEKAKLEKLKDPKALEELRKREERNQQKADEAARIKAMRDAKAAQNGAR